MIETGGGDGEMSFGGVKRVQSGEGRRNVRDGVIVVMNGCALRKSKF